MFNNAAGGCGNDLAIDDIIFRSCGDLTRVTRENDTASRLDVCEENAPLNITLKATPDYTVYSTHFFQWQESSDEQNWSDIAGETGDTYTTNAITHGTYYRVKVAEILSTFRITCVVLLPKHFSQILWKHQIHR